MLSIIRIHIIDDVAVDKGLVQTFARLSASNKNTSLYFFHKNFIIFGSLFKDLLCPFRKAVELCAIIFGNLKMCFPGYEYKLSNKKKC